jgi:FHS family glucose/mannose:H+ symporter-like MFS transporter
MNYKKNQVFAAACIALLLFGMTLITLGSIMPSLRIQFADTGLSESYLAAILPIGILLGSLVFGPIVDRYGYKLLLIASIIISAVALEGLAFTRSVTVLYFCIFFIGFGGGIINGGTSALVADISPDNKGASLSLLGVFFGIGAVGMPLLLGVMSRSFHFTTILAGVGVGMFLPVLLFIFITFPAPKQQQGFPLAEGVKLIKQPALLLTGLFLAFQSGVESLVNNWTTSFLHEKLAVTLESALYALSFSVVGLTAGRLVLGALLKKTSSFGVLVVSLLLVAGGCAILSQTGSYQLAFAALIMIGMGLAAGFPVMLGYVGQLYPHLSGTAFSIAFVIALAGNTVINYSFGRIADRYNISYLPFMVIACIACMLFLLFIIRNKILSKANLK